MNLKPYLWILLAIAFLGYMLITGIHVGIDDVIGVFAVFAGLSLLIGWIQGKLSKSEEE